MMGPGPCLDESANMSVVTTVTSMDRIDLKQQQQQEEEEEEVSSKQNGEHHYQARHMLLIMQQTFYNQALKDGTH